MTDTAPTTAALGSFVTLFLKAVHAIAEGTAVPLTSLADAAVSSPVFFLASVVACIAVAFVVRDLLRSIVRAVALTLAAILWAVVVFRVLVAVDALHGSCVMDYVAGKHAAGDVATCIAAWAAGTPPQPAV